MKYLEKFDDKFFAVDIYKNQWFFWNMEYQDRWTLGVLDGK